MNQAPDTNPSAHPERVPHACLVKLKGIYHSLKRAERLGADYLMASPDAVADMGIVDFASKAGCSEATVIRLARKLGYEGFPELKADFAKGTPGGPYLDVEWTDSPKSVLNKVFANSIQALKDTLELLDLEEYRKALDAIVQAQRIAFFGLGNAAVVAREAYQKFLRIGVTCFTAEDSDLQLLIVNSQLSRGDVVVAISYTGESRPMLNLARQAAARGVTVLAITNFPRSSLARVAGIKLLTAVFQEHVNGEVGAKRLAQLAVLESLYVNYLVKLGARARKHLVSSSEALSINKNSNPVVPTTSG